MGRASFLLSTGSSPGDTADRDMDVPAALADAEDDGTVSVGLTAGTWERALGRARRDLQRERPLRTPPCPRLLLVEGHLRELRRLEQAQVDVGAVGRQLQLLAGALLAVKRLEAQAVIG